MGRVNTDSERSDRIDDLRFVRSMKENENTVLWITRCINVLIQISLCMHHLKIQYQEDIPDLIAFIENIIQNFPPEVFIFQILCMTSNSVRFVLTCICRLYFCARKSFTSFLRNSFCNSRSLI